jgi:ribosomal protein L6P/L9E
LKIRGIVGQQVEEYAAKVRTVHRISRHAQRFDFLVDINLHTLHKHYDIEENLTTTPIV